MRKLKLKVCGMRTPENISGLVKLNPDFIGFIFYKKSKRFINGLDSELIKKIPRHIKKVGVFVNEDVEVITTNAATYQLDFIQLHGDEDVEFLKKLKKKDLNIIKVFRVTERLPENLMEYHEVASYFLFDTDTKNYGGSGEHFDWSILAHYDLTTPYLLSGGISTDDIETISNLDLHGLYGIDVNSRFESAPGFKNLDMLGELVEKL